MIENKNISFSIDDIEAFVFDFDGVLTNNQVHLDQSGTEWVSCSRADGLAFDVLKKLNKKAFILSTELNPVVTARANKLKIEALQGVKNKVIGLSDLAKEKDFSLSATLYVGNDVNDYHVMLLCGLSACPSDSHPEIKKIASVTLDSCGGNGIVRELLEKVFNLDFIKILYSK